MLSDMDLDFFLILKMYAGPLSSSRTKNGFESSFELTD